MSTIGHKCQRYPWMMFRWTKSERFDGRMLRLFEYGHEAEVRMARNLRAIGVDLKTEEPGSGGKQWTVGAYGGHFGGSTDGIGKGFPEGPAKTAVWENKTMGDSTFKKLITDGIQKTKPEHYTQIMGYMGLLGIDRAVYTVENKNTDEIYSAWIHFKPEVFDVIMNRALSIIDSYEPPPKVSNDPSFWICKGCQFFTICHKGAVTEVNCRTCAFSAPTGYEKKPEQDVNQFVDHSNGGTWHCRNWKSDIPLDAQRKGCGTHRMIPIFLDKSNDFVDIDEKTKNFRYKNRETGVEWEQGEGPAALSSEELVAMQYSVLAADAYQLKAHVVAQGINTSKVVGGSLKEIGEALAAKWDEQE